MRRWVVRGIAAAIIGGAALAAYAVGNGDVRATPDVSIITIASTTAGGTGTTALDNTTSATTYSVLVGSDASCDPALMFSVSGGNPVAISPLTQRTINLTCPPRGSAAMRRCLYHATNNTNGSALADFMNVCLYGSATTLVPQQTTLDFGTVTVGGNAMQPLAMQHAGTAAQTISRIYLQTSDLDGNFQFSAPCNPDAPFCDEEVMALDAGDMLAVQIKCTPQTPGMHTAQLYIGTNTFQLLSQPVTVQCMGAPATVPVLGINPTSIDLATPVEVTSGSAATVVHLTNAGGNVLAINGVRIIDVDAGAAVDWSYAASGECTGQITSPCSLDPGDQVDLHLTFDPTRIGRRRATLLVSYKDTTDRTKEITLDGSGLGATLGIVGGGGMLAFGQVPVGRTSTVDFALENHGNRDVTAALSLSAGTSPPFSLSPGSSVTVMPNVDRPISVTCAPLAAQQLTTAITASAMDAITGSQLSMTATCEGSTLALYGNPTAINLGEVRKSGGGVHRTIQLLGTTGTLNLVGQPQLEGANAAITLGPLSQQTTPTTFDVDIDPSSLPEGELAVSIVVTDDDGETLRIPVTGKIVSASYEVASALDLGTFCVNQPTTPSNVSLASDGTARIALAMPTLALAPSPFQLSPTSPSAYPSALAAGLTATLAVTPLRQGAVTQLDDTLTWHTDVEGAESATTAISARFIDQGAAIAPHVINFGEVKAHLFTENSQRIVIQNCNPTPLELTPAVVKSPFVIDNPNPLLLNPNEAATFSVGFHPTAIGVVTETLRITSPQLPNMPLEVTLVGEGTADTKLPPDAGTGSNGVDHTSFYACGCKSSRPSGLVPILIALVCVLFPRRAARASQRRNRLL